jgi:hypothetical protein
LALYIGYNGEIVASDDAGSDTIKFLNYHEEAVTPSDVELVSKEKPAKQEA